MINYHFDRSRPLTNSELRIVLLDGLRIRAICATAEEAANLGKVETALFDFAGGDLGELVALAQAITEKLLAEVPPGEFATIDHEQLSEIVGNGSENWLVNIALLRNGAFPRTTECGAVLWSTAPIGMVECGQEFHFDNLWWTSEKFQPEDEDED